MKIRELRGGEPEIDDLRKEIEYEEGEYQPSELGPLDHEELAERAIDDEPDDDQSVDFGNEEDGDDDPKSNNDSRRILAAPPKTKEPLVFTRNEYVSIGDPSMDPMSKGIAGDGIIYLNDIGETVKLDEKGPLYI